MNECSKQDYIKALMLYSAQAGNILPLTSRCNVNCIFCSNHQNSPGVEVFNTKPVGIEEVRECLEFMDIHNPVIIGESVTRISEGEPFTHPQIKDILRLVRRRLPGVPLQITTNGSLLSVDMVSFLAELGNVTLYLSLNSCDPVIRAEMMRDKNAGQAVKSAGLLREAGVRFHGSIVAMPHIYGYDYLWKTILYLAENNAETIRVFIPGYTKNAPDMLRFPPELPGEVRRFVTGLRGKIKVPVTCEPPLPDNLRPEVAGVIEGSPAERAGILPGDIITEIDGYRPYSRVDAFNRLRKAGRPRLLLQRSNKTFACPLEKDAGRPPGVVMEYDLGPEWEDAGKVARRYRAQRLLVVTSSLARNIVPLGMELFAGELQWEVITAPNHFFGGSIGAAGLLVVEDMAGAIKEHLARSPAAPPDLVLLPAVAFDHRGRDLTGRSYKETQEQTRLPVEIL